MRSCLSSQPAGRIEPSGIKLNALGANGVRFLNGEGGLESDFEEAITGVSEAERKRLTGSVDAIPMRPSRFRKLRREDRVLDEGSTINSWVQAAAYTT